MHMVCKCKLKSPVIFLELGVFFLGVFPDFGLIVVVVTTKKETIQLPKNEKGMIDKKNVFLSIMLCSLVFIHDCRFPLFR